MHTSHFIFAFILFSLFLYCHPAAAADSLNISLTNQLPLCWGGFGDIALTEDNLAIIAAGPSGIRFLDISNPQNPREIGWYIPNGSVIHLLYDSTLLYFNNTCGYNQSFFNILDISDPLNPQLLSHLNFNHYDRFKIAKYQDYCYIPLDIQGDGFYVIDVSDPQNPFTADSISAYEEVNDICITGNYAVTAEGKLGQNRGIGIFDLNDPAHPNAISWCELPQAEHPLSIFADSAYAYVTDSEVDLAIINISNPNEPFFVSSTYFPFTSSSNKHIFAADQTVYISQGSLPLLIVDVSNPADPELLSEYDSFNIFTTIVQDDTIYASTLEIIDAADPQNPQLISCRHPTNLREIDVNENLAYLGFLYGGFEIVDITDLQNPIILSCVNNNGQMSYVYDVNLQGNLLYVVHLQANNNYLRIYDVTDATSPIELGSANTFQFPDELAVSNNHCYVGTPNLVNIFDVTDPANILPVGNYNYPGMTGVQALDISGNYLFVAHSNGLAFTDVSVPSNPVPVDTFRLYGQEYGNDIIVAGDNICFATTYGIYIFTASLTSGLQQIGFIQLNNPKNLVISIQHLLASGNYRLYAVNIENPANPFVTGYYDYDFLIDIDSDVEGNLLFRAEETNLTVYDIETALPVEKESFSNLTAATFSLFPPYPNPFNEVLTIPFTLEQALPVKVVVYDALGREVRELGIGNWELGKNTIVWEAGGLSSGVYYVWLMADSRWQVTEKVVLIK